MVSTQFQNLTFEIHFLLELETMSFTWITLSFHKICYDNCLQNCTAEYDVESPPQLSVEMLSGHHWPAASTFLRQGIKLGCMVKLGCSLIIVLHICFENIAYPVHGFFGTRKAFSRISFSELFLFVVSWESSVISPCFY